MAQNGGKRQAMFEKLQRKFAQLTHLAPEYKHSHPQFAAVALLVHVMAVDGHIDAREEKLLHDIVLATIAKDERETYDLIFQAERDEKRGFDFNTYIIALKNTLQKSSLLLIVNEMMQMMLADDKIRELEVGYILRVAEMLGLTSEETNAIYQEVIGR
jgi:uncharacterized tellurite resistance protein B-like protein